MADNDQPVNDDLSVEGLEKLVEEIDTPDEGDVVNVVNVVDASKPPEEDPLGACKKELKDAEAAVGTAQTALDEALKHRNVVNKRWIELRQTTQLSLHDLNKNQKKITRVENARRFRAAEAIEQLRGHYRPGKREHYPLSPASKAAVGTAKEE